MIGVLSISKHYTRKILMRNGSLIVKWSQNEKEFSL